MINVYIIPAAREDADRKNIMIEIENLPNGVAWRTYRQGSGEVQSGLTKFDKDEYPSILFADSPRILIDPRDRSILYAESMEDVGKVFVPNPHYTNRLDANLNEIYRVYKVVGPLSLETAEVQSMNKDSIDDDFVKWVQGITAPSPEWEKLLEHKLLEHNIPK